MKITNREVMLNLMSSCFTSDTEFWPSTPYLGVKLKPQEASNSARMCNKWCGGFTGGLTRRTQQWNSSHANPSQGLRNPKWTGFLPVPSWPGCHTGWEGAGLWPGPAGRPGERSRKQPGVWGETTSGQPGRPAATPATLYGMTFLTVYCPVTCLCALRSVWPASSPSVLY